ncbi:hypothetical protein [Paenibacillus sp. FSL R5-0914]|uniref:hypothetical protein n=1 Tax=Paenibacillus sp. FSL R5-0914 TaxID=2921665 RepID=UPI0030F61D62
MSDEMSSKKFAISKDFVINKNDIIVPHAVSGYYNAMTQKSQEMMERVIEDREREAARKDAEAEQRHQESLQSTQKLSQALSEAITNGRSVTISIEGSTIHNLQQNVDAIGNTQNNYVTQGIDVEALISTLKGVFEYLPEEEKIEANEALVELNETIDANEKPKKSVLNYLKSFVKKAASNPAATIASAKALMVEGDQAVEAFKQLCN